jgi:hypothetical protein
LPTSPGTSSLDFDGFGTIRPLAVSSLLPAIGSPFVKPQSPLSPFWFRFLARAC